MTTIQSKSYTGYNEEQENLVDFDRQVVGVHDARDRYLQSNVETYECPIVSTDYEGLSNLDPRLADRKWRLNNLYHVVDEFGNLSRFHLRPAQEKLLNEMHYRNIVLKARQLGFTTFICIFLLDYALFNHNRQIGIVAHTQLDATVIFRKIKVAWENLPFEIKQYLKLSTLGDSKSEYEFSNGSSMRIATTLRSGTYQAVLITEFGKICAHYPEKAEEIITGTLPAVPRQGLVFIESTAEGEDGRFFDMVQDARELEATMRPLTTKDFKFFFFPWYENPADILQANALPIPRDMLEYFEKLEMTLKIRLTQEQKNWYYVESNTQKAKMKQEHPSTPEEAFLSSGNKLFNIEVLEAQMQMCQKPLKIDGDFTIYKYFVRGHRYGLGADVSMGIGKDSSTIVIIDFTTGEVVLTYRSNTVDPVAFAYDIKKAGSWYGVCIVAPEANNMGIATIVALKDIYPNIYTQTRVNLVHDHPTQALGWLSTGGSKPRMMYELSEAMESNDLQIIDKTILLEARTFNKEDALVSSNATTQTRHFDLLTACAIAWQMKVYTIKGVASEEEQERVEHNRVRTLTRTSKNSFR